MSIEKFPQIYHHDAHTAYVLEYLNLSEQLFVDIFLAAFRNSILKQHSLFSFFNENSVECNGNNESIKR